MAATCGSTIEWGANNLDPDRMRKDAADLLALAPDVVLATTAPIVVALQQASRTVPIAFATVIDPVGAGVVASLARPEGEAAAGDGRRRSAASAAEAREHLLQLLAFLDASNPNTEPCWR